MRRHRASQEARSGIDHLSSRFDNWIAFGKNIGWLFIICGGLMTGMWNLVGKPAAQQFVAATVQERISGLESGIADLRVSQEQGKATDAQTQASIDALSAQIKILQAATEKSQADSQRLQDATQQILELLKPKS